MYRVTYDRDEFEFGFEVKHPARYFRIVHVVRRFFEDEQSWIAVWHLIKVRFVPLKLE